MKYYYSVDGVKRQGPVELSDILEMQKRNQLPVSTKVCLEGYNNWENLPSATRNEKIGYILVYAIAAIMLICMHLMAHR